MTSREERIVLRNLSDLLASDLAQADDEALVAGLADAEHVAEDARNWSGAIVGELKRRYSWSRVVELTGMKQTTLHNRMYGRAGRREEPPMPEPASVPEHQPVVAAIVTSHLGVLAGRRNDKTPPWTFIAGEVEPGESASDAAVREVKEETGLEVRAGQHEIGRRVHPATKRTMIYLACTPIDGTDVFVGDEQELAEVRWLTLREVDDLLKGLYKPVREHLARVIS
jgi:NADH pyrophosphatase NudC (nudix superfamily)